MHQKPLDKDRGTPYHEAMRLFKLKFKQVVTDNVSGFRGKVTGKAIYATGCKQYLVSPCVGKDNEWRDEQWFDESRLVGGRSAGDTEVVREKPGGPRRREAPRVR